MVDENLLTLIVGQLDSMRCAAIQKLLASTHELNRNLYEGKLGCGEACSAMMLGFLQRGLWTNQLLDRIQKHDQRPFEGIAFDILHCQLALMDNLDEAGCCDLQNLLGPICVKAEACLKFSSAEYL